MQITDEMVEAAAAHMMQYGVNARESTIYAAACSALTAALAAMWRPIEEANKNGLRVSSETFILAHAEKKWIRFGKWYVQEGCWYYSGTNERSQWAQVRGDAPTHFMPLPSPPNISARSSAGSEQPPSKRQVAGSNPAERASSSPQKMEG